MTDTLKELVQSLHQKKIEVDAKLFCETFLLGDAVKLVQIPNFSLYCNIRENTTGWGIAMYVNDKPYQKQWLGLDVIEEGYFLI